jgi:hypothetical protein
MWASGEYVTQFWLKTTLTTLFVCLFMLLKWLKKCMCCVSLHPCQIWSSHTFILIRRKQKAHSRWWDFLFFLRLWSLLQISIDKLSRFFLFLGLWSLLPISIDKLHRFSLFLGLWSLLPMLVDKLPNES